MRNQVTMVGKLGKDADITKFENGSIVARFPIAVVNASKNDAKPNFYRMFAWGNTANFIHEFCKKGSRLAVTGRLVNRTFLGENGDPVRITEVEVRQVVIL
jgi:single-strand DNA-binding protein